jgi:hypothetical protein
MTAEDYEQHFIVKRLNELDEDFEVKVTRAVNEKISKLGLKPNEYLSYKHNISENRLNRFEFHKTMNIEKYGYTAE